MAKVASKSRQSSTSAIRVVSNKAAQEVENITRPPDPLAPSTDSNKAAVVRIVRNSASQATELIADASSHTKSNEPRLANGFKVVRNRSYQRVQKIKRQELRAPVDDEMGHKKLFTKFEEGFLSQDIEMIGQCLSPAFQWRMPNGDVAYGKRAALDEMERRFAMPNGPRFEKAIWRFEGTTVLQTYGVEYLGPDGRWRKSKGFDIYEIGDGLITLKDAYWKMIP